MDRVSIPAGESEVARVETCHAFKAVTWLTIPAFVLIFYLPCIHFGVVRWALQLIPVLKVPLTILFVIIMALFVLAWVCAVRITLSSNGTGTLILTEQHIIGWQKDERLEERIEDIQDVRIDQALAGKVFGYADLTIVTNGRNLTVKGIGGAVEFRKNLLEAADITYYN